MNANMPRRRRPSRMPPETLAAIEGAFETLKVTLEPHLVRLTPEQRRALPVMTEQKIDFIDAVYEHVKAHPETAPPGMDVEEFLRKVETTRHLKQMAEKLRGVLDALDEGMLQVDPMSRFEAEDAVRVAMEGPRPVQLPKDEGAAGDGERGDGKPDGTA